MALQLTQDNLRQIRYQLYQDQVFLVPLSALRILLRALDLVKLFVLAYKFGSPDKLGGKILNFPEKVIPLCHE